jgi:hypothetical protein
LTAIGHFEVPIAPDYLTSESLTLTTASAFRQVRFFPFQRSLALILGAFVELMGDSPDNLVKEANINNEDAKSIQPVL